MLINGVELSSLGVTLYDRVLSTNTVDTASEWLDGDIQPTHVRQQDRFKKIKLSFLVLTKNEEEAFYTISHLTALIKKATIKFDDMNLIFETALVGEAQEERLKNGSFVVTYNLISDYAQGEREIYTTDSNATNAFKLNILYYQNNTTLIAQEDISLRAGAFKGDGTDTFGSIGVDVNKYRPDYYDEGITNLGAYPVTFDNLQRLSTLIINYAPTKYNVTVNYFMDDGNGFYNELYSTVVQFTYPKLQGAATIGQLIDLKTNRPGVSYATRVSFDKALTVENLLLASPIYVYYDKVDSPLEKVITLNYYQQTDNGVQLLHTGVLYFKETDFYDGLTYADIFNLDGYRPNPSYYEHGIVNNHESTELITFETLETSYDIYYMKSETTIYVEYYLGTYPGWYRLGALPVKIKYHEKFETQGFTLEDFNIDINRYQMATYTAGTLYNAETYTSYDSLLTAGILQVYYLPIDFKIQVRYYKDATTTEPLAVEQLTINELTFVNNPVLNDIVAITAHRPEGWQFAPELSYQGEITLAALTHASPINIVYTEIEQLKTKNIIIRYKQQYKSGFSTINTSILTINEADTIGGVRLKDIINLNAYRPDYYEEGIIDNASATALLTFDNLLSDYTVVYMATTYTTSVRYFIDEVDELKWIGSSYISYRVIDFELDTTLYDLGFNPNLYKPSFGGDGQLQYHGAINFVALRALEAINVTYDTQTEPDDPSGIDYPHRFLFLQHNDLGNFEHLHPYWTMNHAYINTGVTAKDMSKLTVIMECAPVDKDTRMDYVNANYAYLFGSSSGEGEFYMRFNNQTNYGANLTGVNTYEARAGRYSNKLILTEDTAVGFGANSGIYASEREGYSYATFTYTNNLESEKVSMPYPLYLFANNNMGSYQGGIANIGIYSCRIYYDGQLIRDMIPVQFYDKIGDKIAPSNCLYDKVTQRFFEDGTGLNSFNIIDDDRYEDTNPEHRIGKFFVQYHKNGTLFQTSTIYMRESDFVNTEWDPYEKALVDHYQPPYYSPGTITNIDELRVVNFDNVNNFVFKVNYEQAGNVIVVNYYMDKEDPEHLIKSEEIIVKEEDFYQVPTFGDIVRLNKYRPEHYQTDFEYPDTKVTLGRIIDHAPYNIVYVPATDETEYSFKVRYTKKIFGWRTYETIAVDTITLTRPEFRDGEYVDFFFDLNAHKPERFYSDGIPYGFYEMDERLTTPADLPDELVIRYEPVPQSVSIDYYKDNSEIAESITPGVTVEELIASTSWTIQVDDFDPRFSINPPDDLPNSYVNAFRPVSCQPGQFRDPTKGYTFEELIDEGHIDIIYKAIYQPHDPDNDIYEGKVLWWGELGNELTLDGAYFDSWGNPIRSYNYNGSEAEYVGGRIPYIDLGYRPNAMERLRVEIKCVAKTEGFASIVNGRAFQTEDYTYFFGYYAPDTMEKIDGGRVSTRPIDPESYSFGTNFSPYSAGAFALRARLPQVSSWVYTANGPQLCDGQTWYSAGLSEGAGNTGVYGQPKLKYIGLSAMYRKGYMYDTDVNWRPHIINHNYGLEHSWTMEYISPNTSHYMTDGYCMVNKDRFPYSDNEISWCGRPSTIILDAWNSFGTIFTDYDNNTPVYQVFDESADDPIFEGRPRVQGSISLFATTDPMTGKVNNMPFCFYTYPNLGSAGFGLSTTSNPYGDEYVTGITSTVVTITGLTEGGEPIYQETTQQTNVKYAKFRIPINPQLSGCAVWSIKLWDRDRLVRDLIPVAKGDRIYDYVMPENGLFDKVTEIFFGNSNEGGEYTQTGKLRGKISPLNQSFENRRKITPEQVLPLRVSEDWCSYGKVALNYFDYDYSYLGNRFVQVPTWFNPTNTTIEDVLEWNEMKPDEFHLDGLLDMDSDIGLDGYTLRYIYDLGAVNVFYKLRTFTKSIVYYKDNVRLGSRDVFYNIKDIEDAKTLDDLGINVKLYQPSNFKPGRVIFNEQILKDDDIRAFIDAPAPIVVYDKYTKEEEPDLFYVEYYRGGAYDDGLITPDPDNPNYLNCNLTAKVLNPNGTIQWDHHYHSAYYEDEDFGYFIPYQVDVMNKYVGLHRGPGYKYDTLAIIVVPDTYTIVEERNGWGRLKEYEKAWVPLYACRRHRGPGQNPDYDIPDEQDEVIDYATEITITRLTIDRLWGWTPDYNCWVKIEELSYSQSGKLYNGLDIKVIDLSRIDFDAVNSWEDMGVYPQLKKLYYHQEAEVPEAAFNYEFMSNLHGVTFVYQPDIYKLNVYYKTYDGTDRINLAKETIEYSVDNWSPDWDTFIANSWKTDNTGTIIAPEIYRDTPLALHWTFFGVNKNKYRPLGYSDGIALFNPHPWDLEYNTITFKEILLLPDQEFYYVPFDIGAFQGTTGPFGISDEDERFYFLPGFSGHTENKGYYNENFVPIDYDKDINIYFKPKQVSSNYWNHPAGTIYDVRVDHWTATIFGRTNLDGHLFSANRNNAWNTQGAFNGLLLQYGQENYLDAAPGDVAFSSPFYVSLSLLDGFREKGGEGTTWTSKTKSKFNWKAPLEKTPLPFNKVCVLNLSNNRSNNQIVFGNKNSMLGVGITPISPGIEIYNRFSFLDTNLNPIEDSTNLKKTPQNEIADFTIPQTKDVDELNVTTSQGGGYYGYQDAHSPYIDLSKLNIYLQGGAATEFYGAAVFRQNKLRSLYIPMPKGMILPVYGYIERNRLIDVLRWKDVAYSGNVSEVGKAGQYDVFAEKPLTTEDRQVVIGALSRTYVYQYPELAATVNTSIVAGGIVPATKYTNGYEGYPSATGWYYIPVLKGWAQQSTTGISSKYSFNDFDGNVMSDIYVDGHSRSIPLYIDPECTTQFDAADDYNSISDRRIIDSKCTYKDKSILISNYGYNLWMEISRTELAAKEIPEDEQNTYIITPAVLRGYNHPVDPTATPLTIGTVKNVRNYYNGDRIKGIKSYNGFYWTGEAWVSSDGLRKLDV